MRKHRKDGKNLGSLWPIPVCSLWALLGQQCISKRASVAGRHCCKQGRPGWACCLQPGLPCLRPAFWVCLQAQLQALLGFLARTVAARPAGCQDCCKHNRACCLPSQCRLNVTQVQSEPLGRIVITVKLTDLKGCHYMVRHWKGIQQRQSPQWLIEKAL
jgi:hypothetical protein